MKGVPVKLIAIGCASLLGIVILIGTCIGGYFLFFNKGGLPINFNKVTVSKNSPEAEKRVTLGQSNVFVSYFATADGGTASSSHVLYRPFLSVNVGKNFIKSIKVVNFEGKSATGKGEVLFVAPPKTPATLDCYNYIGGECDVNVTAYMIKSGLKNGIYECNVTDDYTYLTDCWNQELFTLEFYVVQKGLGSFDSDKVSEQNGFYNSEDVLKYVSAKPEDLSVNFSFVLQVEFEDGVVWSKKYSVASDGNMVMNEMFYQIPFEISDI